MLVTLLGSGLVALEELGGALRELPGQAAVAGLVHQELLVAAGRGLGVQDEGGLAFLQVVGVEPERNVKAENSKNKKVLSPSQRSDKPAAILWILRNCPEIIDSQICKLIGTTKPTIASLRDGTHRDMANLRPKNPVAVGLCKEKDLDEAIAVSKKWTELKSQPKKTVKKKAGKSAAKAKAAAARKKEAEKLKAAAAKEKEAAKKKAEAAKKKEAEKKKAAAAKEKEAAKKKAAAAKKKEADRKKAEAARQKAAEKKAAAKEKAAAKKAAAKEKKAAAKKTVKKKSKKAEA